MKRAFFLFQICIAFLIMCCSPDNKDSLVPTQLRTEYKINPVIDKKVPRLSWVLESEGYNKSQSAYQILVASSPEKLSENDADCWNSEKVKGKSTNQINYLGSELESERLYYWQVRSWDENDVVSGWSEVASWEMGLLQQGDWKADWIANNLNDRNKNDSLFLPPVPYFRKEVSLKKQIKKARLHVTAFGNYDFFINGKKIGDWLLAPGWTNYHRRVYYQTFDVTNYLSEGENALGAMVSKGWYAGYVGFGKKHKVYGDLEKLKAQLNIEYENGEQEHFVTDKTWKSNTGALLESDMQQGEIYDARLEPLGWNKPGFDDSEWTKVLVYKGPEILLEVHPGNKITYLEEITPKTITKKEDESYIFNMGQNFAGVVTLKTKGEAGQKIVLKFGEMLHPDGRLMTENLRHARATDTYILKGDKEGETWTPQFTFHGFQYVQVFGLTHEPDSTTIIGKVIGSKTPIAGSFECSSSMVNQLYSNIVWTQKANFIDIPTDCPQRDERLGWTGDAQVYVKSATLNNDISAFYSKWLVDLNDDQLSNGTYPNYAPFIDIVKNMQYSPGWGEAGIICPWQIYKSYGDKRVIEKFWNNMELFLKYHIDKAGEDYLHEEASFEHIYPKGGFSDWLSIGKKTAPELLTSMYFAYCSKLMAEMAEAIGKVDRADYYKELNKKIKEAITDHYWDNELGRFTCDTLAYGDGEGYVDGERGFTGHTQTAYANAIYMEILSGEKLNQTYKNLASLIEQNDNKLSTGFLGVKQLLPAISQAGRTDLAYTLLLNKEYPSWGFEIENGATTIWERWNSYTKEEGFVEGMNSFSHYAFGAVNEWMFNNMAGIKNGGTAYDTIIFQPEFDERIDFVKATHTSMNGEIISQWKREDAQLNLEVLIPVNSVALIKLPFEREKIAINPKINQSTNESEIILGSGKYTIKITL